MTTAAPAWPCATRAHPVRVPAMAPWVQALLPPLRLPPMATTTHTIPNVAHRIRSTAPCPLAALARAPVTWMAMPHWGVALYVPTIIAPCRCWSHRRQVATAAAAAPAQAIIDARHALPCEITPAAYRGKFCSQSCICSQLISSFWFLLVSSGSGRYRTSSATRSPTNI